MKHTNTSIGKDKKVPDINIRLASKFTRFTIIMHNLDLICQLDIINFLNNINDYIIPPISEFQLNITMEGIKGPPARLILSP